MTPRQALTRAIASARRTHATFARQARGWDRYDRSLARVLHHDTRQAARILAKLEAGDARAALRAVRRVDDDIRDQHTWARSPGILKALGLTRSSR